MILDEGTALRQSSGQKRKSEWSTPGKIGIGLTAIGVVVAIYYGEVQRHTLRPIVNVAVPKQPSAVTATTGNGSSVAIASGSGLAGSNPVSGSHNNGGRGNTTTQAGVIGSGLSVRSNSGAVYNVTFPNLHGNITINFEGVVSVKKLGSPLMKRAVHTYNRGVRLAKKHRYVLAEFLFLDAVDKYPGFAQAWNNLAVVATIDGKFTDAIHDMQKAVRFDPDSPIYHSRFLSMLVTAMNYDSTDSPLVARLRPLAESQLQWLLAHDPNLPGLFIQYASLQMADGDIGGANLTLMNGLRTYSDGHLYLDDADYSMALELLGIIYAATNRPDMAKRFFEESVEVDSRNGAGYYALAKLDALHNQRDEAIAELRKAVAVSPMAKRMAKKYVIGPNPDPAFGNDPAYAAAVNGY